MYTNKKKFHVEEAAVTVLIIEHVAKPLQCQGCRKTYHVYTRDREVEWTVRIMMLLFYCTNSIIYPLREQRP